MAAHAGRTLIGVPIRVDADDMRAELASDRYRDAEVGIEGSLPQARSEFPVLGMVEGEFLLLPSFETIVAHFKASPVAKSVRQAGEPPCSSVTRAR